MLPPIYTMNNNPVHVQKAGAVRQDMGCCGIQSSVPMLPNYGEQTVVSVPENVMTNMTEQVPSQNTVQPSFLSRYRQIARIMAMGIEYSRSEKITNTLVAGAVPYIYFAYFAYDMYSKNQAWKTKRRKELIGR